MKFYETMYIVHPILEMGRLHDIILDIDKNISKNLGEVIYTKVIGKKRMAYPIQKQKFGTYVLVQFKSDGSNNYKFAFDMENNPNILRHLVISIDESEIEEQTEELKDQISGLNRPKNAPETKEEDTPETKEEDTPETKEEDAPETKEEDAPETKEEDTPETKEG